MDAEDRIPDEPTAAYPHPIPPAPGVVLGGRYALNGQLGRGATATVWRARDTVLERDVAVKVFDEHRAAGHADARRSSEVRLLAGLSHPGLVAVYDAGGLSDDEPCTYLVMELVDGDSLHRRLNDGPLARDMVRTVGEQLAGTLSYLHERRVVHRDVKPANILLTTTTTGLQAKLTDFGIARLLDADRLTVDGMTVGTPNYLSPEQVVGGDVGPPSDVYALGLVLLEALTGELGYPGHGIEVAVARLHRPPAVPAYLEPPWPELLRAMTAFDAAGRPTAQQVADALQRRPGSDAPTLPLTSAVPPVAAAVPAAASRRRRRAGAVVFGAAAVAAAAVVALVVALSSGGTPGAPTSTSPPSGGHSSTARAGQPGAPVSSSHRASPTSATTAATSSAATSSAATTGAATVVRHTSAPPQPLPSRPSLKEPPGKIKHPRPGKPGKPGHGKKT